MYSNKILEWIKLVWYEKLRHEEEPFAVVQASELNILRTH